MQLSKPKSKHLLEMMGWFANEQELLDWSGPSFRYPFDLSSFSEDLKLSTLHSFVFESNEAGCMAFGQFYRRLDKCHLGRLIINPACRGQGMISVLMEKLRIIGLKELNVTECSLFVLAHNKHAIKAYKKFGFLVSEYPGKIPLDNCLYMIKS